MKDEGGNIETFSLLRDSILSSQAFVGNENHGSLYLKLRSIKARNIRGKKSALNFNPFSS